MVRCARCGRKIQHPLYIGGIPYGRRCYYIKKKEESKKILELEEGSKT